MMETNKNLSYKDRDALYDWIMYYLLDSETNKKQKQSIRRYFDTGDISQYIADGQYVDPTIVTFFAPQQDIEYFKVRLKTYWSWILEGNDYDYDVRYKKFSNLDEQFERVFSSLYSAKGALLEPEFHTQIFKLVYGEVYDFNREFPIALGDNGWKPSIQKKPSSQCTDVMLALGRYLFELENSDAEFRVEGFINTSDYFISLIPHLKLESFSTELYKIKHKVDGKRSFFRMYQSRVRGFFGQLYGIPTKEHLEQGYNNVPNTNQEVYDKIKNAVDAMDMPDEFYEMMALFDEYGSDAYDISI